MNYLDIYNLVFGQDSGQVCCCFHPETRPSAGIGPEGQYHCFVCDTYKMSSNPQGFISNYFGVPYKKACTIHDRLHNFLGLKYNQNPVTDEQRMYLKSLGICDKIIDEHMFCSNKGFLFYAHRFNGTLIGTTMFNNPALSNYNASMPKYKYNIIAAGMLSPYDDVAKYNTIYVCEGEKDMLTAKSIGLVNAVAKIGGAQSLIIGDRDLANKNVVLIYDCDTAGKRGALKDAEHLVQNLNCNVKIINLGLQDTEDLNDYIMKYGHTKDELVALIKSTPLYVPQAQPTQSKVEAFLNSLDATELAELKMLINMEDEENANN